MEVCRNLQSILDLCNFFLCPAEKHVENVYLLQVAISHVYKQIPKDGNSSWMEQCLDNHGRSNTRRSIWGVSCQSFIEKFQLAFGIDWTTTQDGNILSKMNRCEGQMSQKKDKTMQPSTVFTHFLLPVPIDRSSKLLSVSSRLPRVPAVAARVKDDLDSKPGWTLCVEDKRLLLETSRLDRPSLGSPEELGLLLDIIGLFEELPLRVELRALSESGCCKDLCVGPKKDF